MDVKWGQQELKPAKMDWNLHQSLTAAKSPILVIGRSVGEIGPLPVEPKCIWGQGSVKLKVLAHQELGLLRTRLLTHPSPVSQQGSDKL